MLAFRVVVVHSFEHQQNPAPNTTNKASNHIMHSYVHRTLEILELELCMYSLHEKFMNNIYENAIYSNLGIHTHTHVQINVVNIILCTYIQLAAKQFILEFSHQNIWILHVIRMVNLFPKFIPLFTAYRRNKSDTYFHFKLRYITKLYICIFGKHFRFLNNNFYSGSLLSIFEVLKINVCSKKVFARNKNL